MSRSLRAAGMIMGGVRGLSSLEPDRESADLFASYAGAGIRAFLFPGFLVREPRRLESLTRMARQAAQAAGLGQALIVIGGNSDPSFGLPPFPLAATPLGLASSASPRAALRAGFLLGSRLAACGVDMVLAPRLDLASDPKDRIGALETFGEDSRLAGILGSAYVRGLARAGVAAGIGRFPGLGSTCSDCAEDMPFVALPVERLERCEMRPFARVVASGVAGVVVGRVLVPALESERIPASASARVIEGRLRESFGFRGIAIGDDIGPAEDPGKAAILGALAGCDLGLFSRPDEALAAAKALDEAAATGALPTVRVEMARRRLEALLGKRPEKAPRPHSESSRTAAKAKGDIERGISALRGSLELEAAAGGNYNSVLALVFLPPEGAPDADESEAVIEALRSELPGATILAMPANPDEGTTDELVRAVGQRGRFSEAVILTYDAHFRPAQEGLARLVDEFVEKIYVIAMRDPYDAAFFPGAVGLGAAFGFSEGCARAVGRLLSGKFKARGGRPVEVIGLEI